MEGLIHIYTGHGKGKTSASIGLAIRAIGNGIPVVFVQFMKDGTSGEIKILKELPETYVMHAKRTFGFYRTLSEQDKEDALYYNTELLKEAIEKAAFLADKRKAEADGLGAVLILDESIGAYNFNLLEKEVVLTFLKNKPENMEVVLTGRNPSEELLEFGDYISSVEAVRHPYSKGIPSRNGIEL